MFPTPWLYCYIFPQYFPLLKINLTHICRCQDLSHSVAFPTLLLIMYSKKYIPTALIAFLALPHAFAQVTTSCQPLNSKIMALSE